MIRQVEQKDEMEISGSFEGIPYKGAPLNIKNTDNIENILKLNRVVHVKTFALKKDEALKEYENVCQAIQDGHAQLSFEDKQYVPADQNWVVLVRWIEWWYSPKAGDK